MITPVVHVRRFGNLGNQMFQLMAARSIARRVPGCVVSAEPMPAWGLLFPHIPAEGRVSQIVTSSRIPVEELASDLREGRIDHVELHSYGTHIANFSDGMAQYARDFRSGYDGPGGSDDELVINIRAGEVLDARHPDYVLVPIDFITSSVASMKLRPVFCGQTAMNNRYLRRLHEVFPDATFIPDPGPVETFEYMRRSRHILPSISTFSWLAAWFSSAETILLPLLGLYNPFQARAHNFVPLGDPRYKFYLFPASYAVPVEDFEAAHRPLDRAWRLYEHAALRDYMVSTPRVNVRPDRFFAFFDEAFYCGKYPDVRASVTLGFIPSGRHHYEYHGIHEGREPFGMDAAMYVRTYPIAALEIGQGDYISTHHHYVEAGFARGYMPKNT
jgi:hypothetical protein